MKGGGGSVKELTTEKRGSDDDDNNDDTAGAGRVRYTGPWSIPANFDPYGDDEFDGDYLPPQEGAGPNKEERAKKVLRKRWHEFGDLAQELHAEICSRKVDVRTCERVVRKESGHSLLEARFRAVEVSRELHRLCQKADRRAMKAQVVRDALRGAPSGVRTAATATAGVVAFRGILEDEQMESKGVALHKQAATAAERFFAWCGCCPGMV